MPDIFIDKPERQPDAAVTLPSFAVAIRAVDSRIDPKTGKQAEIARRDGSKGGGSKAAYHILLADQPAEWHEALFLDLAAAAVLDDAAKGGDKRG